MTTGEDLAAAYAALLAADPSALLAPLVEQAGGELREVRLVDVTYRPRRDAHLRFAATVERDGRSRRQGWVVRTGGEPLPGTLPLDGPTGPLSAWRVRDDPVLAGLRLALDRTAVGQLLDDLGVPSAGLRLELLAYRPQRRAVVVARTPTHELYVKCVPPEKAAALHARHRACREAGVAVPRPVGYDPALGLLVLTPVPGSSLRDLLMTPDAAVPPAEDVVALASAFRPVALEERARSPLKQARGHAQLLRTVAPFAAARVDDLLGRVLEQPDDGPLCGVHGDFYDSQVLVRDGRVTGVVDVDGAGTGHPADDAGNLLAHLMALRVLVPEPATVHRFLPEATAALRQVHEPQELGRRTAAVLLGLATWPHDRQAPGWQQQTEAFLDLAEQALDGRL